MGVGLDADTEYLRRSSIPSGGAGTLSEGGFSDCFVGVWVYRDSADATYALTNGGSIIHFQSGAREVKLGFNSTGGALADLNLQIIFNSGGGTGSSQTFASYAGDDFLDEWVYYFILENATDGQIAGYILLSDLNNIADSITRANDNAGSQYINTLTLGNDSGGGTVVAGWYAYGRAVAATGITTADALAWAANDAPDSDWGFWPIVDNADTGDDSGNGRNLTFNGTLTSESSPTLGSSQSQAPRSMLMHRLRRAS